VQFPQRRGSWWGGEGPGTLERPVLKCCSAGCQRRRTDKLREVAATESYRAGESLAATVLVRLVGLDVATT
jgi:hypothetical protein